MLTHHTLTFSRLRVLLLALISVVAFSITGFSQKKIVQNGRILSFNGNTMEISPGYCDSTMIVNPVTGMESILITLSAPHPIKLNGNKIYYSDELNSKVLFQSNDSLLGQFLIEQITTFLIKLNDGHYDLNLNNIVIDEKGKLVYYEFNGIIENRNLNSHQDTIQLELKNEIDNKIKYILNNTVVTPAKYQNTNVPSLFYYDGLYLTIVIKNHKIVHWW